MSSQVKVLVKASYNGEVEDFEGPPEQPLQAVFEKALHEFEVRPSDQSNLGLFLGGNEVSLSTRLGDLNVPEGAVLILQARRAGGGGNASPFLVPPRIRSQTEELFRRCGSNGWECVVFWAVSRATDSVAHRITRVFHPEHGASRYLYEVTASELHRIGEALLRERLKLVIQLHTHPGAAFHSTRDDAGPVIHSPGFVSLVLPNFARDGLGPDRGIVGSEYTGRGAWRELTVIELETLLMFEN